MTINGIEKTSLDVSEKKYQNSEVILKSLGKRKCAIASLVGYRGQGQIFVNNIAIEEYFQHNIDLSNKVMQPFKLLDIDQEYDIILRVKGGGLKGQAEAIQLAVSRAFAGLNPENRSVLKKQHLLTRDARIKERKKYGLKKARKASQFSKR